MFDAYENRQLDAIRDLKPPQHLVQNFPSIISEAHQIFIRLKISSHLDDASLFPWYSMRMSRTSKPYSG